MRQGLPAYNRRKTGMTPGRGRGGHSWAPQRTSRTGGIAILPVPVCGDRLGLEKEPDRRTADPRGGRPSVRVLLEVVDAATAAATLTAVGAAVAVLAGDLGVGVSTRAGVGAAEDGVGAAADLDRGRDAAGRVAVLVALGVALVGPTGAAR